MVRLTFPIFICTWFIVHNSISGLLFDNYGETILMEVYDELGISKSIGIRNLNQYEFPVVISSLQAKYENLARKYVQVDGMWAVKYTKLNNTYIRVETIAKHWHCSTIVKRTMKSFALRALGDEYGLDLRKQDIDTIFETLLIQRKQELSSIMKTICFINDADRQKSKLEKEWEKLRAMGIHINNMNEVEGNVYLLEVILDLSEATSIEEAFKIWKNNENFWKMMRTKWLTTKDGELTIPKSDDAALMELTRSLENTIFKETATSLQMDTSEKEYITTVMEYARRTKTKDVPKHFKKCVWVCHKTNKDHIKEAITCFKNSNYIQGKLNEKSNSEVIEKFCEQYNTLNQIISQLDFPIVDLFEYPSDVEITKNDIEKYIDDFAGKHKMLSAALQAIISLSPELSNA